MDDSRTSRHSVWSQFSSPILENAVVMDFEEREQAREIEIRKVRRSINEMSKLLEEMQLTMCGPLQSDPVPSSSSDQNYTDAYSTAQETPMSSSAFPRRASPAFGFSMNKTRSPDVRETESEVRVHKPQFAEVPPRASMRASVLEADGKPSPREEVFRATDQEIVDITGLNPKRRHRHKKGHARKHSKHSAEKSERSTERLSERNSEGSYSTHLSSQGEGRRASTLPQSTPYSQSTQHPQVPPIPRHQYTRSKMPRSKSTSSVEKAEFTKEGVEQMLHSGDYKLEDIDLPASERKLLEKFISTLSKLSVEVYMDEEKRQEGRRRMNNALKALEGWL